MNFDFQTVERFQCVQERDGSEAEPSRIDDDCRRLLACHVDAIDQPALVIGLLEIHGELKLPSSLAAARLYGGQGVRAVDLWLSLAQEVQIGAVEDEDVT